MRVAAPLMSSRNTTLALACAATFALAPNAATAEQGGTAQARQAVFAQMLSDPANVELMSEYARLSVSMRDFEAAVATLERLLDIEPQNTAARIELAVAYFSLGSYAVAEYHFGIASGAGLAGEQAASVAAYRDQIADRSEASTFTGHLAFGQSQLVERETSGSYITGALEWRIDLGDANVTTWVTDAAARYYQDDEFDLDDLNTVTLRTGPEFRLSGDAYGARLQPYVEFEIAARPNDFASDREYSRYGLHYQNPISASFTVFADVAHGHVELQNFDTFEYRDVTIGAVYRPSRDTRLRVQISGTDDATPTYGAVREHSARIDLRHEFDLGYGARRWVASAHAGATQMQPLGNGFFADVLVNETLLGVSLQAFVYDDFYIEARASQMTEMVEDPFFFDTTITETLLSMQAGWEF